MKFEYAPPIEYGWSASQYAIVQARIADALWNSATRGLRFLPRDERLKSLVLLFLAEKQFVGARGIQVTERMRVAIAAQACLPILELGIDWYSGWTGVVLYPGDFRVRRSELDEAGVLHEFSAICPHLKCVVRWDHAEKSWDCPCHGSRFDALGKVLNGPSIADLEPIEHNGG